jgi:putative metallopeptidase DUF6775
LDFRFIHIYSDDSSASIDVKTVASEIAKYFPKLKIETRPPFFSFWNGVVKIEQARIADLHKPFEKQPDHIGNNGSYAIQLYDGFVLQRLFMELVSDAERYLDHLHIVFTSLLTCTFSEDDWRYHARAVICGTPSIISTTGIVEAPAKPREFYIAQYRGFEDTIGLKKQFADRFIDYGDEKISAAAVGYALQVIFFFITNGEAFCMNESCRLFNAHWQEDLIRTQIQMPKLCSKHQIIANKFNNNEQT